MDFDDFMKWGMITFIILFLLFIIGFVFAGVFINTIGGSQGQHTGYVTAVEFNNNILWDANIVYFKTDTESTQEDLYCVNDNILKINLEQYAKEKAHVTIRYSNPFIFWNSECNGGISIIKGVEKSD